MVNSGWHLTQPYHCSFCGPPMRRRARTEIEPEPHQTKRKIAVWVVLAAGGCKGGEIPDRFITVCMEKLRVGPRQGGEGRKFEGKLYHC